ncbi:MAG: hypothetical protein ACOX6L_02935 [Syntrophomonadaceae bacterium]
MQIIVAIDDSRRIDGGGGGENASLLAEVINERHWGVSSRPSRHRLYPHPETGYRRHNTARSFSADIVEEALPEFIEYACNIIKDNSVPDSNTGLVIIIPEKLEEPDKLISFAYQAKESIVTKNEAMLMENKDGIYIFPLCGDGKGVIGALAGAGLRITGNDGQFRGKLKLGNGEGYIATVQEIIAKTYVEQVKNMDFEILDENETVRMGEKVKVVLLDNKYTLMVYPTELEYPRWQSSTSHMLRTF